MEINRDDLEKKLKEIRDQTEGWAAYWINKPVSFALTRRLVKTSITPNQITGFNLIMAVLAAFCLIQPKYGWRVVGAMLMYFSSIVDGCDGEVARVKGLCSKFGAWFDTVADDLSNNLFFAAVFTGLFWSTGNRAYWTFGWIALALSLGVTAVIYHQLISGGRSANAADFVPAWRRRSDAPSPLPLPLEGGGNKGGGDHRGGRGDLRKKQNWFEMARPVMKRDFFIAVIFVFIILDLRPVVFWLGVCATGVTFVIYVASFITQIFRK